MTTSSRNYTRDLATMLHGVFEKNEVHDSVGIVVVSEGFLESVRQCFLTGEPVVHLVIERGNEIGEDERIRVLFLVELAHLGPWEGLLRQVGGKGLEGLEIGGADQTITIDALTLMSPKLNQVVGLLDGLVASLQDTLEDVGQMTHIELVMEID